MIYKIHKDTDLFQILSWYIANIILLDVDKSLVYIGRETGSNKSIFGMDSDIQYRFVFGSAHNGSAIFENGQLKISFKLHHLSKQTNDFNYCSFLQQICLGIDLNSSSSTGEIFWNYFEDIAYNEYKQHIRKTT